jgi:hypothetical protein
MSAILRDYSPSDFEAIRAIHEQTSINYQFPDINQPLFLVKKVLEVDGVVRAAGGAYIEAEMYLWMDNSDWAYPEEKMEAVKLLDKTVLAETWLKGIDCGVLYLPPGMERFGKRLEDLGWSKPRDGWTAYSKPTERK